ncbi:MAG TPA: hypothetical protein VM512_15630 [Burkholderiaceae bacterium]|jgi:hypothetical protein|nr:hypothetical protein [Burkholderiaceae bacterium]
MNLRALCAVLLLWTATPAAEASPYHDACVAEAREAYRDCRDATGDRRACAQDYHAERHHCARIERRAERNEMPLPMAGWPQGRFVPTPIPQRMPYILPGMK